VWGKCIEDFVVRWGKNAGCLNPVGDSRGFSAGGYWRHVLGRVAVGEGCRQHGQGVGEDDHSEYDGDYGRQKAEVVVTADVAVPGSGHGDDGEVERYGVALALRQVSHSEIAQFRPSVQPAVHVAVAACRRKITTFTSSIRWKQIPSRQ